MAFVVLLTKEEVVKLITDDNILSLSLNSFLNKKNCSFVCSFS